MIMLPTMSLEEKKSNIYLSITVIYRMSLVVNGEMSFSILIGSKRRLPGGLVHCFSSLLVFSRKDQSNAKKIDFYGHDNPVRFG